MLGALVEAEEPAEAFRLLLAPLAVAVHGHQRCLADCQQISGLQIQVLLLVLGKRMEGDVLETFHRHFLKRLRLKMAAGEKIQLEARLHREGSAAEKSSKKAPKKADGTENVGEVVEGAKGGRSHPKLSSILKRQSGRLGCCTTASLGLASVGALVHFPQLEAPVEPDDGAEGERRQHAPRSGGTPLQEQPRKRGYQSGLSLLRIRRLLSGGLHLVWTHV